MIAILQNHPHDGPSYLGSWLRERGFAFDVIDVHDGQPVPRTIAGIDGLAVLGGPMSVSDDLPELRATERLIRAALARHVPVLGHCLGGQLIASALGATVQTNARPEIGWHRVGFESTPGAREWFGDAAHAQVFQWHYDNFAIPAGAVRLATGDACANQAFAIGNSLAMQFHVEVDQDKLDFWRVHSDQELAALAGIDTVQQAEAMRAASIEHLAASQALAGHIYARWVAGMAQ